MSWIHAFEPRPRGRDWTSAEAPQDEDEARKRQASQDLQQLAHLPAALLSTLKRDKKPFTYTPGGVDLSEVLEARLRRRMERKKRYREENPSSGLVVVSPTYNTPLDLYSAENALEVLEVQAGLGARSPPPRSATLPRSHTFRFQEEEPRGVTQSKAFRVLQIMTDTEEDVHERSRGPRGAPEEETRFTGLRDSGAIPSRFFHTLQKMTGTDGDVPSGPRPNPCPAPWACAPQPPPQPLPSDVPRLRRPADFLPSKTFPACGFRPVQPPAFRSHLNATVSGTTDF